MHPALSAATLIIALAVSGCGTTRTVAPPPPVPGDALTERLERVERDVAALRTQITTMQPSVERLVQIEDDIRALLEQLSPMPAASAPTPAPTPAPAPVPAPAGRTPLAVAPAPGAGTRPPTADPLDPTQAARGHALHLASYRTPRQVGDGWRRLLARFPEQLGTLTPRVVGIDFGDGRGTFYRLKAGPLPDEAMAEALCRHIRSSGEFCGVTDFTGTPGEEFWNRS